jgi:hypothetical protein
MFFTLRCQARSVRYDAGVERRLLGVFLGALANKGTVLVDLACDHSQGGKILEVRAGDMMA